MQHRLDRKARGRHRRTEAPQGHRAPRTPLLPGDHGRYAMLSVALVAGVGVAGVSAATASATPGHLDPAAAIRTDDAAPSPLTPSPSAAVGTADPAVGSAVTGSSIPTADADAGIDSTRGGLARASASADAGIASVESVRIPPAALSFVRTRHKERPVPVVLWVNPLPEATVTSCFGQRWGRLHAGVDLAAPDGTRLRAAGAGVVVVAGPAEGYGNAVLIDHGNGFLTHYGHMSAITVLAGQTVAAGEQIGNEGSTGHSTGPHLHFEVHQGFYQNPIEPTQWMHDHGVDIPGCVTFTDAPRPAPGSAAR